MRPKEQNKLILDIGACFRSCDMSQCRLDVLNSA